MCLFRERGEGIRTYQGTFLRCFLSDEIDGPEKERLLNNFQYTNYSIKFEMTHFKLTNNSYYTYSIVWPINKTSMKKIKFDKMK